MRENWKTGQVVYESIMCESSEALKAGIDNTPPLDVRQKISNTVKCIIMPLSYYLEDSFVVTSGYRCEELNKKVGGVSNSQHLFGEAVDIRFESQRLMAKAVKYIYDAINFDQLILYKNFIHVSIKSSGRQRREVIIKAPSLAAKLIG